MFGGEEGGEEAASVKSSGLRLPSISTLIIDVGGMYGKLDGSWKILDVDAKEQSMASNYQCPSFVLIHSPQART